MPELTEWNALCARCESVYDQYGHEPIPTFLSDDPCAVFLATDVKQDSNLSLRGHNTVSLPLDHRSITVKTDGQVK